MEGPAQRPGLPSLRAPRRWWRLAGIIVTTALVAGCGSGTAALGPLATPAIRGAPSPATPGAGSTAGSTGAAQLTVFAAASLRDVLRTAAAAYEAAHPGATLALSTGSSAALEAQIEQGAPADLFLSADLANPQALVERGMASGPVVPFARNTLTVVVPAADPAAIRSAADLARPGVRVVAAGDAVPISAYARRVVAALATQPGYPPDFAARYDANVVSKEEDVKSVLAKVALGEADAGIVYATDAASSSAVRSVPIPVAADVIATYGAVIPAEASDAPAARAFLEWLTGPDGRSILIEAGFLPPS